MEDDRGQKVEHGARQREPGEAPHPEEGPCSRGDHAWLAFFFKSGRLAYWQCERCGVADRETEPPPERLNVPNDWVESPVKLRAQGTRPPSSDRRWATTEGTILVEGDPSSTDFVGLPIPDLEAAHAYVERDKSGKVLETYEPNRKGPCGGDHYWLTRFLVVGNALVRFHSHCYEDSTYEVPHAGTPEQTTILSGLEPIGS